MRAIALSLIVAGCGRINFDPLQDGGDSALLDGAPVPIDAAPCLTPGPWTTPVSLTALDSTFDDWSPALSGDTLRLVFQSNRSGNAELYEATRAQVGDPFGSITLLATLDSSASEAAPTLSVDGRDIIFTSDRSGLRRLYHATRPSVSQPFGTPLEIVVAGAQTVYGPALTASQHELFYNDMAETTISRATFNGTQFVEVGPVTELGAAAYPSLSRDELTIYFSRTVGSQLVIFQATRASVGAVFGTPIAVAGLDLSASEEDAEIGKDDRTLVFAASVTAGDAQLYLSTRVCM